MPSTQHPVWESWKEEFRHGAFYLFPPRDLAAPINELRARLDPTSAAICDAHISLSEPLVRPLSNEEVDELRCALATVSPLQLSDL